MTAQVLVIVALACARVAEMHLHSSDHSKLGCHKTLLSLLHGLEGLLGLAAVMSH